MTPGDRRAPSRRRRAAAVALGVAGVLAVAGGAVLLGRPPELAVAATPVAPTASPPAAIPPTASPLAASPPGTGVVPPAGTGAAPSAAPAPAVAVAAPVRLAVPDLGIAADVVPSGVAGDGALVLPEDPGVLGWWSSGAVPGAAAGGTVLAAHVDAAGFGAGPMSRLLTAAVGTSVEVTAADGAVLRYTLAERRTYGKDDGLPRDLFRVDGPPRLVLITCAGRFDAATGHYAQNAVLVAVPATG